MDIVRVKGKLMRPYGLPIAEPWADAEIKILFCGYTQTALEQRPSDRLSIKTAADGSWAVDLWVNEAGDYRSYYLFLFPHTKDLKIVLPNGLPPENEFSQLAIASTPPSDPSYPSLVELINTILGSSGVSFPAGGVAGQVLAIAQETPRVLEWANGIAPLQFAQATPAAEWLWNHNLGFRPKPQVYNLAYQEIEAEVEHTSLNQLRVRVSPAMPGFILI